MSFISLDIGTNRIAAVQGSVSGSQIDVTAAATVPLRRGTVTDSLIKDQGEAASAIARLIGQDKTFKARKAIATVNPGNALVREFTVPSGSPKQLKAMVKSEMLSYNAAVASDVIEFKILENATDTAGPKSVRIRAVALSNSIVESQYNLLKRAKLRPTALDINSNAVEKLLARRPQLNGTDLKESSFVLLDFGYSGVLAYIVYDYRIYASRSIPIGLSDFETAIYRNRFEPSDADGAPIDFKQLLDFRKESAADPKTMRSALETLIQCCNEIQKLIMYSAQRIPRNAMFGVFLAGDGSAIPGIDGPIASELNIPVMPLSSVSGVRFSGSADEKDLPYLLNAVGAMIRL